MDTDVVPLSHFALFVACLYAKDANFILGMPQIYTCTDTQTHAHTSPETPAHTDTDTCTHRHRKHTYRYTQIHIHIFFLHKQTCIHICQVILPAHFIFSCNLPNELRSHGPIFIYLFTSLCLFCMHIVDMIEAVLGMYFHTSID